MDTAFIVVQDKRTVENLKSGLLRNGYLIKIFESASEALKQAFYQKPKFIFCDRTTIQMLSNISLSSLPEREKTYIVFIGHDTNRGVPFHLPPRFTPQQFETILPL